MLDIVDVPLLEYRPVEYQQENWILDPKYYWVRVGVFHWSDLNRIAEEEGNLWRNGSSTQNGTNDRIPIEQASAETSSLKLVYVENLRLQVFAPGQAFGNSKRRVQACFRYAGSEYALWVTDPLIEREYLAKEDGDYLFGECYLTISLGEPYGNYCYKLVAAVIGKQQ